MEMAGKASTKGISITFSGYLRQVCQNAIVLADFVFGGVSELADEHDLGSCAARRGGSSPPFPTIALKPKC